MTAGSAYDLDWMNIYFKIFLLRSLSIHFKIFFDKCYFLPLTCRPRRYSSEAGIFSLSLSLLLNVALHFIDYVNLLSGNLFKSPSPLWHFWNHWAKRHFRTLTHVPSPASRLWLFHTGSWPSFRNLQKRWLIPQWPPVSWCGIRTPSLRCSWVLTRIAPAPVKLFASPVKTEISRIAGSLQHL